MITRPPCNLCSPLANGSPFRRGPQIGRRMFFRHMGTALSGYFLWPSFSRSSLLKAATSPPLAKYAISIYMSGAPSQVDTFDFKDGAWIDKDLKKQEFNPTSYGGFLFPQALMPIVAQQWNSVAFLRSVEAWALLHPLAASWNHLARNPQTEMAKIAPLIGSVVASELSPGGKDLLPAFVSLNADEPGLSSGFLDSVHSPFFVNPDGSGLVAAVHGGQNDDGTMFYPDPQPPFARRYDLLDALEGLSATSAERGPRLAEIVSFRSKARQLTGDSRVNGIFQLDGNQRMTYGSNPFGDACLTARNLLQANLGIRFVEITMSTGFGWDHHINIYTDRNAGLIPMAHQFDQGFGNLLNDLRSAGILHETLIVVMGEFGRTGGVLTPGYGRDHGSVFTALFAGAGVKGGRVIGGTSPTGDDITDFGWQPKGTAPRPTKPEDIAATIYHALGIDYTKQVSTPIGRNFEYVPGAKDGLYEPVLPLWS